MQTGYTFVNYNMPDRRYFRLGVILLIISLIIGYGGLGTFITLYLWTDHPFWDWAGSGIYTFSWDLFGLGFILSGKGGVEIIKNKFYQSQK